MAKTTKRPPRLTAAQAENFETLKRACQAGKLALVSCREKRTGRPIAVICAVNTASGEYELVPLAAQFRGNPYRSITPPTEG